MSLPSASRLQRAMACLASTVLPQVASISEQAERGSDIHSFLSNVAKLGRDAALALVPEERRDTCEDIDLERLPVGAEFMGEVALVLDVQTEAVRFVGLNVGREYGELGPSEMAMSLDVLGVTGERVLVADFKTGRGRVPSASRNWQLRVGALAAARWKGVDAATVALINVREDGSSYWEAADLDAFDLMTAAADLRLLAKRIEVEQEHVQSGGASKSFPLRAVTGEHCRYCPSFTYCPAQAVLIRRMAGEPDALARELSGLLLTPETASEAYERLRLVQEALKQVSAALYAYATATPIALGDGNVFGPVIRTVERLDALVVRKVLAESFGAAVADAACEYETSKAGVERAMRLVYETKKRAGEKPTLKALNQDALAKVHEAGGVSRTTRTEIREHKPKDEIHS